MFIMGRGLLIFVFGRLGRLLLLSSLELKEYPQSDVKSNRVLV